jgi:hypothetical protein
LPSSPLLELADVGADPPGCCRAEHLDCRHA